MEKPEKPIPSDCCRQGCTPCVYERYAQHLELYKEWLKEQQSIDRVNIKDANEDAGTNLSPPSE